MNLPDYNSADYDESSAPVAQITNLADNFLQQGFKKFQFASKTFELDKYSNEIGLGPISKQLTLDRAKTILAAYALYRILNGMKSNFLKIGLGGISAYMAYQNKEGLMSLFNKANYIERNLAPSEPTYSPTIQTDQMAGLGRLRQRPQRSARRVSRPRFNRKSSRRKLSLPRSAMRNKAMGNFGF